MVAPAVAQVVLIPFPFSDLSGTKLRPAVILADTGRGDWILCQITSNPYADPNAFRLESGDFEIGSLRTISFVRPGKLFTANTTLMQDQIGRLKQDVFHGLLQTVIKMFQFGLGKR